MSKTTQILCALCAGLSSGLALADPALESFLLKSYAEVQFGSARNNIDLAQIEEFTLVDTGDEFDFDDSFNAGIVAGYNFVEERNFKLSWEVSYQFFSESTGGSLSESELGQLRQESDLYWQSIGVGIRAKVMLNESVAMIAKAGAHHWYAELENSLETPLVDEQGAFLGTFNSTDSDDTDGSDSYYGFGFQYHINKNIYAGLEYSNHKISPYGKRGSVKSTSLSAGFNF